MKEDLRMNAKSPDPDDLAAGGELPPQIDAAETAEDHEQRDGRRSPPDRSAPHIPPLEKGKIKSNE